MSDGTPPLRLRIVRASDRPATRLVRRRPGAAVVLILVYAGLFGAGLWWFRSASPLFRERGRKPENANRGETGAPPRANRRPEARASESGKALLDDGIARRAALLAGEGLPKPAREIYEQRIATERCTCGCELTLQSCLARDRACGRSPEIAEKIRASLR